MLTVFDIKNDLNCTLSLAINIFDNQGKILKLLNQHPNSDYFCNQRSIDDIKQKDINNIEDGNDNLKPLTDKELQTCRKQIIDNMDDNQGITNDTLDYAIETIKSDRIKHLLQYVNKTYKQIGDGKNLLINTWLIKGNIILWLDETEEGFYSIDSYDFDNEVVKDNLFYGTLDRCIDYLKGIK
jgi:uncharacterized protein YlaI